MTNRNISTRGKILGILSEGGKAFAQSWWSVTCTIDRELWGDRDLVKQGDYPGSSLPEWTRPRHIAASQGRLRGPWMNVLKYAVTSGPGKSLPFVRLCVFSSLYYWKIRRTSPDPVADRPILPRRDSNCGHVEPSLAQRLGACT